MSLLDLTNFYTDALADKPWEQARVELDEIFLRLRGVIDGLRQGNLVLQKEGEERAQRGTLNFVGQIVDVVDDAPGERAVVSLPDYGSPVGLGNANAAGSSSAVPRADHVHKRDVRVRAAGVDVGTRNAINFVSGAVVVDDPGGDEVEVTISAGGGGLPLLTTVLMGEPQLVWDGDANLVYAEEP